MDDSITDEMDIELIKKKVQTHLDKGFLIHCVLKSGAWKNGLVLEVSADFFIIQEMFEGDQPIFFEEIRKVETYSPRGKK